MNAHTLFPSPLFDRLGWTLARSLWQGSAVAALLFAVNGLWRTRGSEIRYAASCAALVLTLGWTVATFGSWSPSSSSSRGTPDSIFSGPVAPSMARALVPGSTPSALRITARRLETALPVLQPWLAAAWLCGVLLLSMRTLYGWREVERLIAEAVPVAPEFGRALDRLARRLEVSAPVRLLESAAAAVPMAIGNLRPVVLLPVSAATGLAAEELEAILAHELAHIRRHDYLVNLLQTVAETLLFYHPAVWWMGRQIRIERENCCDDLAVEAIGSARTYALALVGLEQRRGAPEAAVAANGGLLWRRVARLLPAGSSPDRASAWAVAPLLLAAAGALGAVSTLPARPARHEGVAPAPPPARPAPPAPRPAPAPAPPAAPSPQPAPEPALAPDPSPAPDIEAAELPNPAESPEPPEPPSAPEGAEPPTPRADGPLTAEQLQTSRIHGVTPQFVRAIAAEGFDRVSPDDLVSLRIHGVTPEYVHAMTAAFGKQCLDTYVSLRIHGVTPEYVETFRKAGYDDLSPDDTLSMRIHGVQPTDAAGWTALGYEAPSPEDLVSLRIHGVDPGFASAMRAAGLADAELDELISLRIHGVTPDLSKGFHALGYASLSAEELVSLQIHGLTREWAARQNRMARRTLPVDELLEMRVKGEKGD